MRRHVIPLLSPCKSTRVCATLLPDYLSYSILKDVVLFRVGDEVHLHQWTKEERPFVDAFLSRNGTKRKRS